MEFANKIPSRAGKTRALRGRMWARSTREALPHSTKEEVFLC